MNKNITAKWLVLTLTLTLISSPAWAKKKRRHRYSRPLTHPVLLWARTLSDGTDREERKVAAFKLSQYSQPIFQAEAINALTKCIKDPDVEIKVLCTKAMGKAGTKSNVDSIRRVLLDQYQADPSVRNTLVRTFIARRDDSAAVQDTLLDSAKKTTNTEELLALLSYFEMYSTGSDKFVDVLTEIYKKNDDIKVRKSVVKALGDRAQGQDSVVELLSQCTETKDTPLLLTCLSGLQQQGKTDARTWSALEKSVDSDDPDVLVATLDVINVLPEKPNVKISKRLVEIASASEDADMQEKAVLALGVCGDQSEPVATLLKRILEKKDSDEGLRVASALMLGRQSGPVTAKTKDALAKCFAEEKAQSLKTACQLGMSELETRASKAAKNAPPPVEKTPAEQVKEVTRATSDADEKETSKSKKKEKESDKEKDKSEAGHDPEPRA